MAYVDIYPTSDEAEAVLKNEFTLHTIRFTIRKSIIEVWDVPKNDIIVMAHHNTVMVPDPIAIVMGACPELVIKINTSDKKQELAERLKDRLLERFKIAVSTISIEIWINFFHTWGCTINFD